MAPIKITVGGKGGTGLSEIARRNQRLVPLVQDMSEKKSKRKEKVPSTRVLLPPVGPEESASLLSALGLSDIGVNQGSPRGCVTFQAGSREVYLSLGRVLDFLRASPGGNKTSHYLRWEMNGVELISIIIA